MTADLEVREGYTCFAGTEDAWHRSGYVGPLSADPTSDDYILARAGLANWNLDKVPVSAVLEGSDTVQYVDIPDKYAIVRRLDNKPLGIVGSQYQIFSNEDLFDLAALHLGEGRIRPATGGSIRGGAWTFLSFHIEHEWLLTDDPHIPFLSLVTSHDGSAPVTAVASLTRPVCWNTVQVLLSEEGFSATGTGDRGRYTIVHRPQIRERTEEMVKTFNRAIGYVSNYERAALRFMEAPFTTRGFDLMLDALFPVMDTAGEQKAGRALTIADTARSQVRRIYEDDPRVGRFQGTRWGALQAANVYETWAAPLKAGDRDPVDYRAEKQIMALARDGQPITGQAQRYLASLL